MRMMNLTQLNGIMINGMKIINKNLINLNWIKISIRITKITQIKYNNNSNTKYR
jgi:hypothetical protein